MSSLPGLDGDIYYGSPGKGLPDWRASETHASGDEAPPTREERRALAGVLGFDPAELWPEAPRGKGFDPDEARDEAGRWADGGAAPAAPGATAAGPLPSEAHERTARRLCGGLAGAAHLDAEARRDYAAAVARVVGAMPAGALPHLDAGVGAVAWHANAGSVTNSWRAIGLRCPAGKGIAGFYVHASGAAHLDGVVPTERLPLSAERPRNAHGVYAHELTHAIDRHRRFSDAPAWRAAYAAEVEGGGLTAYGATSPVEGFAEFGRLLYGSDVPRDLAEKHFPKCFAFFRERGLAESAAPPAGAAKAAAGPAPALDELFTWGGSDAGHCWDGFDLPAAGGEAPRGKGFDPDEPRDEAGRWTDGDEAAADAEIGRAADDAAAERREAERRVAEDEAADAAEEKALAALGKAHEAEDRAVEKARDKEDRAAERARDKEDSQAGRDRRREEKGLEKRQGGESDALDEKHGKESVALDRDQEKRDPEPEAAAKEQQDLQDRQRAEQGRMAERHDREVAAMYDRHAAEDEAGEAKREAEDAADNAKRSAEDDARAARQERELEDAGR